MDSHLGALWIGTLLAMLLVDGSFGQSGERRPAFAEQPERRTIEVEIASRWADRDRLGPCGLLAFDILEGQRGALGPVLLRGTTDEAGSAQVQLELHGGRGLGVDGKLNLMVRIVEPGFQQVARPVVMGETPEEPVHTGYLVGAPGATFRGRVLQASGDGVPAQVSWVQPNQNGKLSKRGSIAQAAEDGSFELHATAPVAGFVFANAGEAGTGRVALSVPAGSPGPDALRLLVHGPGSLQGRVVGTDGRPAAGLNLWITAVRPNEAGAGFGGAGRRYAFAVTGSDGAFRVGGLEKGRFDVVACFPREEHEVDVPAVSKQKQVLASGLLASGEPIEFVVQRPHLVVSLADARGIPHLWDDDVQRVVRRYERGFGRMPKMATPILLKRDPSTGRLDPLIDRLNAVSIGEGRIVFELEAGHEYGLTALGPGLDGQVQFLAVPEGAGRFDRKIQIDQALELGGLEVTAGNRLPANLDMSGVYLTASLEQPGTGLRVQSRHWPRDRESLRFEVPAGSYRVVVEEMPVRSCFTNQLRTRPMRRAEMNTLVTPGATGRVSLRMPDR